MHVRTLDNVSNAQNGASIDIRNPPRQISASKKVEVGFTGSMTGVTPNIQASFDGSDWFTLVAGSAADTYLSGETSAPFCRVVTTGTGGPYTADFFAGRLGS